MATLNDIETKVQSIITILKSRIVKTIIGILPLTFTANAGNAVDWSISGNDEPGENIFNPNGEYTADYSLAKEGWTFSTTGWAISDYIEIQANTNYTLTDMYGNSPAYCLYDADKSYIQGASYNNKTNVSLLTTATTKYIRFSFCYTDNSYGNKNIDTLMLYKGSTAPDHFIPYQRGVGEQRVDGYYVPLTISQTGQTDKNYDIYIGDTPLTAGQSISTGIDIELFEGENTVSTTLYNKPEMTIKYKYNGGN